MAHLQYMPGDPRLVDQLVYELKSKGIFDQFRKDCIADVDTRPAYQNLRQRVENSVSTFLSRQCWKPDLNKNQLREKLRKHILDGNYLEQGVERIVDQVVNPKVTSVFIPQVEDLVYNYLGIIRKKAPGPGPETSEKKPEDLLPTDLEAVSPGSVKSNDDKNDAMVTDETTEKMEVDQEETAEVKEDKAVIEPEKKVKEDVQISETTVLSNDSGSMDKSSIPLPAEEINLENIPAPVNSPPKATKVELETIALPLEPNLSTDIPLPDGAPKAEKDSYFKPIQLHSEESSSSSDSSLRRNMSPLTPIRNFNNENSCDAQQGFDTDSDAKCDDKVAPSSFRFTIENKDAKSTENNSEVKEDKKETDQTDLSYQFNHQVNINTFNTPMYDDSSNSNNLHIDYESDVNSKTNTEVKPDIDNSQDSKKEKKSDDRKSSHKSSHRSRESSRHSSSKDKRSDSKHSTSRDSSRHDKKSSTKDDKYKSSKEREKSKDRSERKDSRDSSKHRSSQKSSNNKDKDSKSHRSSSSSHRHSSKSVDDKKTSSSSNSKDKEKISESSRDKSTKDKYKDSKSSSHRSDKDRKSSSSSSKKSEDKDKKKDKKDIDDHYSSSGRGNHSRRSTDRDSNDGSSSSKGSQNQNGAKLSENKKDNKTSSSKSDNTSTSGDSPSPSDNKEHIVQDDSKISQSKPIVRVDNHLETPIANPPRLPFVPDVTLKKPRFAANLQEAKKLMKMRKFLDDEQKRMNQEAALLLEFQANVRPSLSQVYSSIPGPELEFACGTNVAVHDSVPYEVTNVQVEPLSQVVVNEKEKTEKKMSTDMEIVSNLSDAVIVSKNEEIQSLDSEANNVVSEIVETKETIEENVLYSELMKEPTIKPEHLESPEEPDEKNDNSYDENKPFSELMDEITEYSKASESKTKTDMDEPKSETEDSIENDESIAISESTGSLVTIKNMDSIGNLENTGSIENTDSTVNSDSTKSTKQLEIKQTTKSIENTYFEVTIITEELSESEEIELEPTYEHKIENREEQIQEDNIAIENTEELKPEHRIETENKEEPKQEEKLEIVVENTEESTQKLPNDELQYFAEHEKYNAELERYEFSNFLKSYIENASTNKKMYLINCDTYEENIVKEIASSFGEFEVINYYKNGHLKVPNTTKSIVKDVTLSTEVTLPIEPKQYTEKSPMFSPVKSECSFELSSDYDAKLDDINKKSRQEVMEIILGSILDASPSKMPKIDYYTECIIENETDSGQTNIESETENTTTAVESETENNLKRRIEEVEGSVNNNRSVLTSNKIRKLSNSDQISSTTEETEEVSNNNKVSNSTRSKYLGRARRVGLPRPKRSTLANSPSSDKSVENYAQNTPATPPTPNGKIKTTPRSKVQRYDTSDLYKPKLHYLSRRNNVS